MSDAGTSGSLRAAQDPASQDTPFRRGAWAVGTVLRSHPSPPTFLFFGSSGLPSSPGDGVTPDLRGSHPTLGFTPNLRGDPRPSGRTPDLRGATPTFGPHHTFGAHSGPLEAPRTRLLQPLGGGCCRAQPISDPSLAAIDLLPPSVFHHPPFHSVVRDDKPTSYKKSLFIFLIRGIS